MKIIALTATDDKHLRQAAAVLFESFGRPEAWPTLDEALQEVRESFAEDRISLVATDAGDNVIGWIGGIEEYDGLVWELHPLAVGVAHRGVGVGRALVAEFEKVVRARGGITVTLGTDDLDSATTLGGVDLYPDVWRHIRDIKNLQRHPYEFYQKLGYVITGVMPDANGPGRPDIFMSKSLKSY